MTGRTILVVLAINYDEFRAWCRDSGLSPDDPEVVFVDNEYRLCGFSNIKVIRCRHWGSHPHALRISQTAEIIEQRNRPS
ncbi:hypothetical protein RM704_10470 [Streptomyces sp. DSM 3412]|uniref:Uncharacterized protein n=1 Tax=Streptomyces gottesmaniae TaxID=3075518 RepID=A0ABU2YVG7_9ACTN|nr:hypothetical protein [Streptomyces sp. DSM 3412]MDT0567888.1 hypothetical protein [Streptomyces sp. DSM 3412]